MKPEPKTADPNSVLPMSSIRQDTLDIGQQAVTFQSCKRKDRWRKIQSRDNQL